MKPTFSTFMSTFIAALALLVASTAVAAENADLDVMARESMAAGDVGQAEVNFQEIIRVNPFDAVALNNLAVAKSEQGQYNEALEIAERAARLAPDNTEITSNVARLKAYLQGYAMAGVDIEAQAKPTAGAQVPPAPPPLWLKPDVEASTTAALPMVVASNADQDTLMSESMAASTVVGSSYSSYNQSSYASSEMVGDTSYYTSTVCQPTSAKKKAPRARKARNPKDVCP